MGRILYIKILWFLSFCSHSFAQKDTITTYYDKGFNIVNNNDTVYYSKTWTTDTLLKVECYHYKSKKLNFIGTFINDTVPQKHGKFLYYEEGVKVAEGNYKKGWMIGEWKSYYETGSIRSVENFIDLYGLNKKYTISDKCFEQSYLFKREGVYHGTSIWYHKNKKPSSNEVYKNGELQKVRYWDENGKNNKVHKNAWGSRLITEFPMINVDILKHQDNFFKKTYAKYYVLKRQTSVEFIITKEGGIKNIEVIENKYNKEFEQSIIDYILSTKGLWTIGKEHNLKRDFLVRFPLFFNN